MQPEKDQIRLSIHRDWSEHLLSAFKFLCTLSFQLKTYGWPLSTLLNKPTGWPYCIYWPENLTRFSHDAAKSNDGTCMHYIININVSLQDSWKQELLAKVCCWISQILAHYFWSHGKFNTLEDVKIETKCHQMQYW